MPAGHASNPTRRKLNKPRCGAHAAMALCLLAIGGCFGPNHRELADEAFAANRYDTAVRHYQEALADRPSLSDDPAFAAQFNRAKTLAHIDRAQRRIDDGDYLNAVDELDRALAIAPSDPVATRMRQRAAAGAADLLYRQAINQADLGDEPQATEAIRRALRYRPAHLGALRARDALAGKASTSPEAQQAFEQGRQLAREQRWAPAIEAYNRAIAQDGSLLTARFARHAARQPVEAADALYTEAVELQQHKRLDAAIAKAEQAKALRPHHTGYDTRYASLLTTRNHVERWLTEAVAARRKAQWDQGLVLTKRARANFPYHPRLDEVENDLRTSAAVHHTATADTHHKAGRLDRADDAYRRALAYASGHGPARAGLAETATRRANAAERQGQSGRALLWHVEAQRHVDASHTAGAIQRLRRDIEDAHAIGLSFTATRGGDLESRLVRQLQQAAPGFVRVAPQPGQALTRLYTATVDAGVSTPRVERVRQTNHRHAYWVDREVHNPRVDELKAKVRHAHRALDKHEHRRNELISSLRDHEHRLRKNPGDPGLEANIAHLHNLLRANRHDLQKTGRHLRHAEHLLSCEPRYVVARVEEYWPYTIETYRKRVELTGQVTLREGQTNRKVDTVSVREGFSEEDRTLVGANPAVGLGEDPLVFTDDATIRRRLADRAAAGSAERVLGRTIKAEVAALRGQAKAQAAAGDHDGALESRAAAAVLLRRADAQAAASYLDGLRRVETRR